MFERPHPARPAASQLRDRERGPAPPSALPRLFLLVACLSLASCTGSDEADPARSGGGPAPAGEPEAVEAGVFTDAAEAAGLDFFHFNGMSGGFYMAEVTGAGAALFDYDRDGDLDLYLVQGTMLGPPGKTGRSLDRATVPLRHPAPPTDRLYRNDTEPSAGGGRRIAFTDVTEAAGLTASRYGMGVAAGDYDGDGWIDLYVTNEGPNQLLRNRGDGTFEDATGRAGVGEARWSVPAAFFDADRDGDLDLFVGNYLDFPYEDGPVCTDAAGGPDYCGPGNFTPEPDRLFENRGDGTFRDVTAEAGLTGGFGPALGVTTVDLDADGWPDLYVANDQHPNNLWASRGGGRFADEALLAGAAVNLEGKAEASMGVDAADFDGDGDVDLFMTHLVSETNTLYLNDGTGLFRDATLTSGLGPASRAFTSFGTGWLDYDNDGRLDLLVVNGAVQKIDTLARQGDPFPLHQPNQLFRNVGTGPGGVGARFEEVTAVAGAPFRLSEVSRGAAFGDVDDDGDTDVVVTQNNGPVRLLVNRVGQDAHWVGLSLVDGDPPRDVPGAVATLVRGDGTEVMRLARVGGSYASSNDPRILFGLGDDPAIDAVRVEWPDGSVEEWTDVEAGAYRTLAKGTGRTVAGDRTSAR